MVMVLLCIFFMWYPQNVSNNIFVNDDADYAYAAKQGVIANWFDLNALSWSVFLKKGIEKGMNNGEYSNLSKFIRSSNSIPFYRHYHGPLYYEVLAIAMKLSQNEHWLRLSGLVWLLFLAISSVWVLWLLFPQLSYLAPVLASATLGLSYTGFSAATLLTGHVLFACISLISLATAGKWLTEKNNYWLICSGISGGLALAIIEYAVLIPFSILIATMLNNRSLTKKYPKSVVRYSSIWILAALIPLFVVWPAGIIKLTIVKNYMFLAYQLIMRDGIYGVQGILDAWLNRIMYDPLTYSLAIGGLLCSVHLLYKRVNLHPMLIFAAMLFLTTFKNTSIVPTYVTALLGVVVCLSTIGIGLLAKQYRINFELIAIPLLICAFILTFTRDYVHPDGQDVEAGRRWKEAVTGIVKFQEKKGPVLVIRGMLSSLHLYHPEFNFDSYAMPNGDYGEVFKKIGTGNYTGVYIWGSGHERFASEFGLMDHDYRLIPTGLRGLFIIENSSLES